MKKTTLTSKQLHKQEAVTNVGELISLLKQLPKALPLSDEGYKLIWFNAGSEDEQLAFEENDGTWNEDEDEE